MSEYNDRRAIFLLTICQNIDPQEKEYEWKGNFHFKGFWKGQKVTQLRLRGWLKDQEGKFQAPARWDGHLDQEAKMQVPAQQGIYLFKGNVQGFKNSILYVDCIYWERLDHLEVNPRFLQ